MIIGYILAIVVLLGMSGFFSGSETALTAASRARMHQLEKEGDKRAAAVNRLIADRERLIGSILLGMTTCWVIILIGLGSKQAIVNAPVANFEVTQTGTSGMFIKYQMAAFLAVFAITMLIQFVSYLFEAVADNRDEPGRREIAPVAH